MHVIYIKFRIRGCVPTDMVKCQYLVVTFRWSLAIPWAWQQLRHDGTSMLWFEKCNCCRYEKDLHVIFEDEVGSLNRLKTVPIGQELNEKPWTV